MKAKLLQIHWHEKEPIYSIHFDASGRLATAGGDHAIRVILEDHPNYFPMTSLPLRYGSLLQTLQVLHLELLSQKLAPPLPLDLNIFLLMSLHYNGM